MAFMVGKRSNNMSEIKEAQNNFAEQKNDCQKMIYIPTSLGAAIKERSEHTNTKVNTVIKDALTYYIENGWGGEEANRIDIAASIEGIRATICKNHIVVTDMLSSKGSKPTG